MTGTSWVDLVDVAAEHRVLLVDGAAARAEAPLQTQAVRVTTVRDVDAAFAAAQAEPGCWDVVVLDAVAVDRRAVAAVRTALAPRGRVVVVGDRLTSPLRLLDAARGRSVGPGARLGHRGSLRRLRAAGLHSHQVFGLLRSSDAPVVAFDATAPASLPAVWAAIRVHVHGARGRAIDVGSRLSAGRVLALCPAWVIVAGRTPLAAQDAADRVVAKVSNRDSEEIKLLRGDPVRVLERVHLVGDPTAEVAALRELEAVGFTRAPRVLLAAAGISRTTWMPGAPLVPDRLDADELAHWVARATEVLDELQRLTRNRDGTVLVHGDFWLGNLLVDGDDVSAVVDWTTAHRGSARTDREFLVTSLAAIGR